MDHNKLFRFCADKHGTCACEKHGEPRCQGVIREFGEEDAVEQARQEAYQREAEKLSKYIEDEPPRPFMEDIMALSMREIMTHTPPFRGGRIPSPAFRVGSTHGPEFIKEGSTKPETQTISLQELEKLKYRLLTAIKRGGALSSVINEVEEIFHITLNGRLLTKGPITTEIIIEDDEISFEEPKARHLGGPEAKPYTKFMENPVKTRSK